MMAAGFAFFSFFHSVHIPSAIGEVVAHFSRFKLRAPFYISTICACVCLSVQRLMFVYAFVGGGAAHPSLALYLHTENPIYFQPANLLRFFLPFAVSKNALAHTGRAVKLVQNLLLVPQIVYVDRTNIHRGIQFGHLSVSIHFFYITLQFKATHSMNELVFGANATYGYGKWTKDTLALCV